MSTEKRTITNESGKSITMMIDHASTNEWTLTESQWKRICRESDNTAWRDERGAFVRFTCHPHAADCKYPGRS